MNEKRYLLVAQIPNWGGGGHEPQIPNDEIWYTSSDGNVVELQNAYDFGANFDNNTYSNGKGIIKFDGDVTSIGNSAFRDCTGLTSIIIPDSVTSIVEGAFVGCTGLTYITIGNGVTSIGKHAFRSCTGLTSITIPNSVTSIGEYAFDSCYGLTSITIPDSVTSIVEGAFSGCAGLTSINIPDSVTSIGDWAFSGCTGLTSITIPNSVTSIGNNAFYDVPNIVYYGTATGSPWGARNMNCYVDGYLVYKDETKTKLSGCSSAATGKIVIPNSVTSIGDSAFCYCSGLTSITIPNSVTSIESYAFYDCKGLTSITIPNSVTSIGDSAFYGCTGLTSITIPNSVTSIGDNAFAYVLNIVYYGTATGSPWGARNMNCYVDGYLVYKDETKTKLLGCSSAATGEIVIPNSVTSIGDWTFSRCDSLTSITIPDSVTSIGNGAFMGCVGLTAIIIPDSVTSIGDMAFRGCTGLTSVKVKAQTPQTIGKNVFDECTKLNEILVPFASVDAYKAKSGWSTYATKINGFLN